MMRRRIFAALVAAAMTLSLAACGGSRRATPESLLAGVREVDADGYFDLSVELSADVTARDDDGMTRKSGDERVDVAGWDDSGESAGVPDAASVTLRADVEGRGDVLHVDDAVASVRLSGFSVDVDVECWLDAAEGASYARATLMGETSDWSRSELDGGGNYGEAVARMLSAMREMDVEEAGATLLDREDGDDYVVTWPADAADVMDAARDAFDGVAGWSVVDDAELDDVTVEASFDAETRELRAVTVRASGSASDGAADGALRLTVEFRTLGGDSELSVPRDVVEAAALAGDGDEPVPGDPTEGAPVAGGGVQDVSPERYDNDGMVRDDVIDPMAEDIMRRDPDFTYLTVRHYADGDNPYLSYSTSGDDGVDWGGSLHVERAKGDADWYATEDSFRSHVEFTADWHDSEPVKGSADDNYAAFVYHDYGGVGVDFAFHDGEYYVDGSVTLYDSEDVDEAVARMNRMLDTAGLSSLVTVSVD